MNDSDLILNFLKSNKKHLEERFNITKIGLFGSFALNEYNASSDIDLLVEFKKNTPDIFEKKQELRQLFKSKFNREVDICSIKYIKPYIKDYILSQAIYA